MSVNDYVFFFDGTKIDAPVFNVLQFSAVTPSYVLSSSVSQTFKAGSLVWPMIFGKFSCQDVTAQTGRRGSVQITISELVSPASVTVGVNTPGVGVGYWKVGSTFVVS